MAKQQKGPLTLSGFLSGISGALFKGAVATAKFSYTQAKDLIEKRQYQQALNSAMDFPEPDKTTIIVGAIANWKTNGADEKFVDSIITALDSIAEPRRRSELLSLRTYLDRKKMYRKIQRIDSLLR